MGQVYNGDVGTKIILNAGCEISSAQLIEIIYKKPDRTTGIWKARLENSQSASYTTKEGDLDVPGRWELQLRIVMPDWKGHGQIVEFPIHKSLETK